MEGRGSIEGFALGSTVGQWQAGVESTERRRRRRRRRRLVILMMREVSILSQTRQDKTSLPKISTNSDGYSSLYRKGPKLRTEYIVEILEKHCWPHHLPVCTLYLSWHAACCSLFTLARSWFFISHVERRSDSQIYVEHIKLLLIRCGSFPLSCCRPPTLQVFLTVRIPHSLLRHQ